MASKKSTTRRASKKSAKKKVSRNLKKVRELTEKARKEVAGLLAQVEPGTQLRTGLEEVDEQLRAIMFFQHRL